MARHRHCDECERTLGTDDVFMALAIQFKTEFDEKSDTLYWDVCLDCVNKHDVLRHLQRELDYDVPETA